jgi:hypothetical protein
MWLLTSGFRFESPAAHSPYRTQHPGSRGSAGLPWRSQTVDGWGPFPGAGLRCGLGAAGWASAPARPAELLEGPDESGGDVHLAGRYAVAGAGRVGVVRVVPGLAHGQRRVEPRGVVSAAPSAQDPQPVATHPESRHLRLDQSHGALYPYLRAAGRGHGAAARSWRGTTTVLTLAAWFFSVSGLSSYLDAMERIGGIALIRTARVIRRLCEL